MSRKEPEPLPWGSEELDAVPVHGYTRAGYVILLNGQFCFDAGDVWKAHEFMERMRST